MPNKARPSRKTEKVHSDKCKLHGTVNYVHIPMVSAWLCARCIGEGMFIGTITDYAVKTYPDIVRKDG